MPKYRIKYVYERWYDVDIEASSRDEALDKFHSTNYEEEARLVGGELQDSVVVEEVSNA